MNRVSAIFIAILFVGCLANHSYALPQFGASELDSPNGAYAIKLVDTKDPWTYQLKILRGKKDLADYSFKGQLLSAYWSPSSRFVAVNNHYGHGGFYVWIISLANGLIITAHGVVKDSNYDRYSDSDDFVNLLDAGAGELKRVYPQVDSDQLRNGYDSVAYGWRGDDQLLMFHEFGFDNLSTEHHLLIQAFTTWHITNHSVSLRSVRFRKARDDQYEPMPPEAKKTLSFIP